VRAGFAWSESSESQVFESAMTAGEAFARGVVDPGFSSQLAVLSDEEFDAGVARIRAAEKAGGELILASELHLFATIGWVA
jgi:hypothetical protein